MANFIGRLIEVGLGIEKTRGEAEESTFWVDKMNCTVDDTAEVAIDDSTVGVIEDSMGGEVVREGAQGEISGKVRDISFGAILLAAFGSVNSGLESGETDVYNHAFTVKNDAQHPSLTVEVKNPNQQLAYALAMLESLEITAEVGKYVEYTASFKSKKGVSASGTPTYTLENPFLAKHIVVKIADAVENLESAEALPVRSSVIRINKNLERDDVFGSNDPADILNKQFGAEISLVRLFGDATIKALYQAGDKQALQIIFKNDDAVIGTSEENPTLTLTFPQVLITERSLSAASDEVATENITAKANYNLTETEMVNCVLKNGQEEYIAESP